MAGQYISIRMCRAPQPIIFAVDIQVAGIGVQVQAARAELLRLACRVQVGHGAEGSAEGTVDEVLVNILWAHVHGLATLMLDGPLAGQYADEAHRQAMMGAVSRRFAAMVAEAGGESVHDMR